MNKIEFSYLVEREHYLTLSRGAYLIEAWGACGGGITGGRGAYVRGVLRLHYPTPIFINVGGKGNSPTSRGKFTTAGGYNGGGSGGQSQSAQFYSGSSGGGATDVRLGSNEIENRILVAAGGGGSAGIGSQIYIAFAGGYGGNETGGVGGTYSIYNGKVLPANQTYGGANGKGENGRNARETYANGGSEGNGGGGGGYFGGLSLQTAGDCTMAGGGGGSSYANKNLTLVKIISGAETIKLPNGTISTGNPDNGFLRISPIYYATQIKLFNKMNILFLIIFLPFQTS